MFRIISTTALTLLLAGPALSESHAASTDMGSEAMEKSTDMANLIRTRDITGGNVVSIAAAYDEASWMDAENDVYSADMTSDGMVTIGEIEDIVLDQSGQMIGIVAEVGGFLDIGDKHVMLETKDIRLVAVDDKSYSFVTRLTEEQLEEMPSVNEAWYN